MLVEDLKKAWEKLHVLVIGDLMVDRYLWGKVERISPEAPVPIVDVYKEENRPGGAANVALNLKNLGVKTTLCGVTGLDNQADELLEILHQENIGTSGILKFENRRTTSKIRILGNHQQILRVDKEDKHQLTADENLIFFENIKNIIPTVQAIIFEDYDKGLLSKSLISMISSLANEHQIPTFVDPKFKNFHHYSACTVFKPNRKELKEGLLFDFSGNTEKDLLKDAQILQQKLPQPHILVTLSELGMLAISKEKTELIPAHFRQIVDVSGAGDTVISVLAASFPAGLTFVEASKLANLAGGLVCEEAGVVPINPEKLLTEAIHKKILQ